MTANNANTNRFRVLLAVFVFIGLFHVDSHYLRGFAITPIYRVSMVLQANGINQLLFRDFSNAARW